MTPPPVDTPLPRSFYDRGAVDLAPALLGKTLCRLAGDRLRRARVVETEAYVGQHDLASHAARGRTARTDPMFGPPGHAYVYLIYGMHEMFNIVCAPAGDAQAVLVRAAEPLDGWDANLTGPGRLARALGITRAADNGRDLVGDVLFVADAVDVKPVRIVRTPRVGVDYAGAWKDELLRFCDGDSRAVSKPRPGMSRRT